MIIHENVEQKEFKRPRLFRQNGERNLFLGKQRRYWLNNVQTRKLKKLSRNKSSQGNEGSLHGLHIVNTSGPAWQLRLGNKNTDVPANLLPEKKTRPWLGRRTRRTRHSRRS